MPIIPEVTILSSNPWCSNATYEHWNKPAVEFGTSSSVRGKDPSANEDQGCQWQAVIANNPVVLWANTNQLMPLLVSLPAESSSLYQKHICIIEKPFQFSTPATSASESVNRRVLLQPALHSGSRKFADVWREFSSSPTFSCI